MPNNKNKELVQKLTENVEKSKSIVFADYHGLSAQKMNELRAKLSEIGAEANIAKNTLVKIALKENKIETSNLDTKLVGPTISIFSFEDAITSIKTLFDFASDNDNLPAVKAGVVEGNFSDASQLKTLSELPGKEQLLAQVVGGMKAPLNGFVSVLGGVQKSFVYALSAIAEKKEA